MSTRVKKTCYVYDTCVFSCLQRAIRFVACSVNESGLTHAHTHIHTHIRTHTHTHIHIQTQTQTQTQTHTHANSHTRQTHTRTHTHTHTYTHPYTYTHKYLNNAEIWGRTAERLLVDTVKSTVHYYM